MNEEEPVFFTLSTVGNGGGKVNFGCSKEQLLLLQPEAFAEEIPYKRKLYPG